MNCSKRKVKIVCTLGPSSSSFEKICELIDNGMDIARLNFSHGTHAFHQALIENIRKASQVKEKAIAILQDLQGPKLRAGKLPPEGIELHKDEKWVLYPENASCTAQKKLPISAEIAASICKDVEVGHRILFDDGKIATEITSVEGTEITVQIVTGGKITSHKGMNLPDTPLTLSCLTQKDLHDLAFGLKMNVDAVALSFVRSPEDLVEFRKEIQKHTSQSPMVIPKIERAEAIRYQEEIIELSDGLLIARGDMGVEVGSHLVPIIQKGLIDNCNQKGIPVITATQMLESMTSSPIPTRAEASDVANAVFDGTDAVMLSAETASGNYPIEAVKTMSEIILQAQTSGIDFHRPRYFAPTDSLDEALGYSTASLCDEVKASILVCNDISEKLIRILSQFRPKCRILAFISTPNLKGKMAFFNGVYTRTIPNQDLNHYLIQNGWASPEDVIVTVSSHHQSHTVQIQKLATHVAA